MVWFYENQGGDKMKLRVPAFCDMHVHLRQGKVLQLVNHSLFYSQHILVMPNTDPPLFQAADVREYDQQVKSAVDLDLAHRVHYTIYINEDTTPDDIEAAARSGLVLAGKIYPRSATTGSDHGVRDYSKLNDVFAAMQDYSMVCCIHGEDPLVKPPLDVFDWEKEFVDHQFQWIIAGFPKLRVVLEHITTQEAANAVMKARRGVAATITAHHLFITRDDILAYGIRPLNYCKPVAKGYQDRALLRSLATQGHPRFILRTHSPPHTKEAKFSDCGCAGCFTSPIAAQAVITAFEEEFGDRQRGSVEDWVEPFEAFTSGNAIRFYGLEDLGRNITLENESSHSLRSERIEDGDKVLKFPVWGRDKPGGQPRGLWNWRLARAK
jgi:dihydroorotase